MQATSLGRKKASMSPLQVGLDTTGSSLAVESVILLSPLHRPQPLLLICRSTFPARADLSKAPGVLGVQRREPLEHRSHFLRAGEIAARPLRLERRAAFHAAIVAGEGIMAAFAAEQDG